METCLSKNENELNPNGNRTIITNVAETNTKKFSIYFTMHFIHWYTNIGWEIHPVELSKWQKKNVV